VVASSISRPDRSPSRETMDVTLGFPDGIGILEIPSGPTRLRRPK
jgi:hypothetical protein